MKYFFVWFLTSQTIWGASFTLKPDELADVGKIAKAISHIQPYLEEAKYLQYATGIYRASVRYQIDPNLLIAIAHHETSFRENLPEGAAGELGICQIRKMWVKNSQLRAEFGNLKEKDLLVPSKSFLIAAWILQELKSRDEKGTLPYWAYYNSVRFENRLKYFIPVNRYLVILKKTVGNIVLSHLESDSNPSEEIRPAVGLPKNAIWRPDSKPRARSRKASGTRESSWIANALESLETLERARNHRLGYSQATLRAASEFGVKGKLLNKTTITD